MLRAGYFDSTDRQGYPQETATEKKYFFEALVSALIKKCCSPTVTDNILMKTSGQVDYGKF
ncbi:MAG: hypothetical protein A2W80_16095 [Candidatus Riflebacteria bacterium GWC2_50_8]|nr:MAG: hypothetical protein A2W80_16095 [Candidatus Riflebacteria bacterium GWC2_50_8]